MKLNTHGIKVAAVCSYCYFVPLLVEGEDEISCAFRGIKKKGNEIRCHFVVVCYMFSTFVILCTVCMKLRIVSQVYIVESEKM